MPLIPAGLASPANGALLWTNSRGVRDQLAQNPLVQFTARLGGPSIASRYGGAILMINGAGFLAWGPIAAAVLLVRLA